MSRVFRVVLGAMVIVATTVSVAAASASARTASGELRRDLAVAAYGSEGGQVVQGTGVGSSLRVTVLDPTDAALIIADVTIVDAAGAERTVRVDGQGVALFENLNPGVYQVKAAAESFRPLTTPFTVRRGENRTTLRLALATIEQSVMVEDKSAADRRDNGFTQTLTQEQIDALPDDPDEMADELMRMAGPGAQIFVNGFRGGPLPPKDQIQQIRFHTNSFSAEYHEAGMIRVEVITKPGLGGWRGHTNFGFRDESLNATNAFATEKGPEQMRRYMINFQGPIAAGKTGLSVSFDGNNSYESRTIVAQSPTGAPVNGLAVSPTNAMNFTARVEQQLNANGQLQAEYTRRDNDRSNLGVGDFDLPDRAYAVDNSTDIFRLRSTNVIGKKVFTETRFALIDSVLETTPASFEPTIRVNDAFNAGGAGQMGERSARELEFAQNFDFTIGRKHSFRVGALVEAGWWDSNQRTNAFGTYTFASQDAFLAGTPSTYTIRVGDPVVDYSQVKAGWFIQDDFRPSRTLQLSVGLRHELQTQVESRWNLAPRAAFTWNATRTATVRGGYGIFYDWYDSAVYEQTIRVDGEHQVDVIVRNPTFPVLEGGGDRLPASVIRASALDQPIIHQASIGFEKPLAPWADFRTDYMWTRGFSTLRSVNVNVPIDGARPEPAYGNISEIQSSGERAMDRLTVAFNARYIPRRILGMVMYQLASVRNYADSPTMLPADSTNPDADWGPAAQDVRHRIFFNVNAPLGRGVRMGLNAQGSSALPYNLTSGYDTNGDAVFNDREPGVSRNSGRGAMQWTVNMRLNRSIGLGGVRSGPPNMPMPPPPPPSASAREQSGELRRDLAEAASGRGGGQGGAMAQRVGGGGPGGDGGPQMVVMEGANTKYRLDLYVNVQNVLNRTNYNAFVGNQLSPFFGQATSAAPARRVEVGASISF